MQFAKTIFPIPDGLAKLMRGFAGFASAELANRIVRLGAILIIARHTNAELLGTAALALSLFELTRVLTQAGIGQRIVAANDAELAAICERAYTLFWLCCVGVALIQLGVAAILFAVFAMTEAAAMLAVLSGVYLFMPAGLVQIFLLMRDERLGTCASIGATQAILDHILTAALIILWPSAWAIVLPKLLTAPVWTILARRARPWHRDGSAPAPLGAFRAYCGGVLASEMMAALRLNADKLVISAMLGVQALGTYYFAFGAGLGIAQSLVTAFGTVLFASLCRAEGEDRQRQLRTALLIGLAILSPIVAAQVFLAPIYVPIVFGLHWAPAAPYLALLSCAALPLFLVSGMGAAYRADRKPGRDAALASMATAGALGGLAIGAVHSLGAACAGYSIGLALVVIPAALRVATNRPFLPTPSTLNDKVLSS